MYAFPHLAPSLPFVIRILSVDLAYKRHADIGVALLEARDDRIVARIIDAGLPDPPHSQTLADWVNAR